MTREPTEDAELVAAYRRDGAPEHFEALVRRHREGLLRLVFSVLGRGLAADAEDVVQRAFLRAHDRLAGFRGDSRFSTWLARIAYRLALDHKRRRLRRDRLLRDGPAGAGGAAARGEPPPAPDRALAVRRALGALPEPYQTALRLHYWFELPVAEIAAALGVAPGTVKSYLHRGRARMLRLLDDEETGR